MKKIVLWTIFFPALIFAQTEKITFSKKFTYTTVDNGDLTNVTMYYSPKGIVVDFPGRSKLLVKSGIMAPISLDLDNNATIYNDRYDYKRIDSIPTFTFEKQKQKDQFGGYSCTYYKLIDNHPDDYRESLKMCIAEDNTLNMLSYINNNKKDIIKGFPVALTEGNHSLILKSVTPYSNSISIDFNTELATAQEQAKRYSDDYAVAPVDSAAPAYPYDAAEAITIYQSEYKKAGENQDERDLAIDSLEKQESYWKGIPQYCTELDKKIPEFKDKKLKDHVKNYAGQLCDMYLSFVKQYSVDERGTMDQIRYEENYFRNTEFNKNDKKLLNDFLNSLD